MRSRGSGTILAAGLAGAVAFIAAAGAAIGAAGHAREGAQAAADLAALAGAQLILDGGAPASACPIASEVARRNGARLDSCAADAGRETVRVTAVVSLGTIPLLAGLQAKAAALAGPEPGSRKSGGRPG